MTRLLDNTLLSFGNSLLSLDNSLLRSSSEECYDARVSGLMMQECCMSLHVTSLDKHSCYDARDLEGLGIHVLSFLSLPHTHTHTHQVAELFGTEVFRVFTSKDVVGVEIGGAVKNVIAIAAGMAEVCICCIYVFT